MVEAKHEVVAVVTMPDKPAGRGMKLQQSPVKQYAVSQNIPVLQPEKLRDPAFIEALRSYKADLQVVIAFRMLPEVVWHMPPLGTINLHASLLPDYRGAAPINWAIMNGETVSGVSTFFLKHEIDTGDILLSAACEIGLNTTAGELHDTLMHLGAEVMLQSLQLIQEGKIQGTPQAQGSHKLAPKIFKSHCQIDWNNTGQSIINLVRGMSPYPAAYTLLNHKQVKVFMAQFEPNTTTEEPGKVLSDQKSYVKVSCLDGFVHLLDVQMESKKRMDIESFLRGNVIGSDL
jgi:methionyl-tRNA formyltransferase